MPHAQCPMPNAQFPIPFQADLKLAGFMMLMDVNPKG